MLSTDITPPLPFEITTPSTTVRVGDDIVLSFSTVDDGGGSVSYQATIDGGAPWTVASPLTLHAEQAGAYDIEIAAKDEAGNVQTETIAVEVVPAPERSILLQTQPLPWWEVYRAPLLIIGIGLLFLLVLLGVKLRAARR